MFITLFLVLIGGVVAYLHLLEYDIMRTSCLNVGYNVEHVPRMPLMRIFVYVYAFVQTYLY